MERYLQHTLTPPPTFSLWPHIDSLSFVEDLFQKPNGLGLHSCYCNHCKTHWWPWVLFNGLLSGWTCIANESQWLYTRLFRALNASSCSMSTFQPLERKDERKHQLSQNWTSVWMDSNAFWVHDNRCSIIMFWESRSLRYNRAETGLKWKQLNIWKKWNMSTWRTKKKVIHVELGTTLALKGGNLCHIVIQHVLYVLHRWNTCGVCWWYFILIFKTVESLH